MRPTRLLFALYAACSATSVDDAPPTTTPSAPSISEGTLDAGPLPSTSIDGESIRAGAIDLRVVRKIADQGRWKIACTFDLDRMVHLCATDSLDEKWTAGKVGTRVLVIAKDFSVTEHLISDQVFSSYLWGDFDSDGRPDLLAFRDAEERWKPEEQPPAVLFLGSADAATYRVADPVPFEHAAKAGAVLDVDMDGCADALVLGSGVEKDVEKGDVSYFADALLRGDCHGHFTRTEIASFDKASPRLGRTAVVTELDGDRCPDILVGNYRGFANDALLSDCNGGFRLDAKHPATGTKKPNGWYGQTVALAPYDLENRGVLDLAVREPVASR